MLVGRLPQGTAGVTAPSTKGGGNKSNTMVGLGGAGASFGRVNSVASSAGVTQQVSVAPPYHNFQNDVGNYQNNNDASNQRSYSQILGVKNGNAVGINTRIGNGTVGDSGGLVDIGKVSQSLQGLVAQAEGVSNSGNV